MRYTYLGRTGLRVSEIALGTMTFGEDWALGTPAAEARRVFEAYAEAGGNFVDTANRYTEGTSETLVGEFVRPDRDRFVVATKYTLHDRLGDPNAAGNHRKNMVRSLEGSLKRLGLDHVDLFYVHAWDYTTPPEEVMRGLDDLVRAGKVHHIGISDTPAWVVARADLLADLRGWSRVAALQIEYSLAERTVERELLPMARSLGITVTPWAPLAGGLLSGKYTARPAEAGPRRLTPGGPRLSERNLAIARAVDAVAAELGRPASHVSLAWVRHQPGRMVPIVGSRRAEQLKESLGCLDLALSPEHLARLGAVSAIEMGFPHEFLARAHIQETVYAGTRAQLDPPRG